MPHYFEDYEEFLSLLLPDVSQTDLYESTIYRDYGREEKTDEYLQKAEKEGLIKGYSDYRGQKRYAIRREGLRWLRKNGGLEKEEIWDILLETWRDS